MSRAPLHTRAIKAYKQAHPEIDWDNHIVTMDYDVYRNAWKPSGHREWTSQDEQLLAPCCGGSCVFHAGIQGT